MLAARAELVWEVNSLINTMVIGTGGSKVVVFCRAVLCYVVWCYVVLWLCCIV